MNRYQRNSIDTFWNYVIGIFIAAFVALAAMGWVFNIVAIAKAGAIDGMVALRIIAVFLWPLGCILGWIT